jgi:hypothetical protein
MVALAQAIADFFREKASALRRIAGATRGDMSFEDVKQEAWIVAADMEQRRGYPVDFTDPVDTESVLSWLYRRLVTFAEKQMRHAVRLDKDWDREDAGGAASALARLLTSPLESDPLVRLQQSDAEVDHLRLVKHSYSEASAYVILLARHEWDLDQLAGYLRIAARTLRRRLRTSGVTAKQQPSLFDGSSVIDPDFQPKRERRFVVRLFVEAAVFQRAWRFR